MRFIALSIAIAITLSASAASAALYYTVSPTVPSGNPLDALVVGDKLILDIGVYTSPGDRAAGLSGSVNDYDESIVAANAGESTIASTFFNQLCVPSAGCFNGLSNLETGLRVESGVEGPGAEATFISALSIGGAAGDGSVDEPYPQFQVVMDVIGVGSTVLRIGTFADYADAYVAYSPIYSDVYNTQVAITVVPEPGTAMLMGLGLAGLAGTRRRVVA